MKPPTLGPTALLQPGAKTDSLETNREVHARVSGDSGISANAPEPILRDPEAAISLENTLWFLMLASTMFLLIGCAKINQTQSDWARPNYLLGKMERLCGEADRARKHFESARARARSREIFRAWRTANWLPGFDPSNWARSLKPAFDQSQSMTGTGTLAAWWAYNTGILDRALGGEHDAREEFHRALLLPDLLSHHLTREALARPYTPTNAYAAATNVTSLDNIVYVDGVKYPLTAAGLHAAMNAACNGRVFGTVTIAPGTISLGTTSLGIPNNCDIGGTNQASTVLTLSSTAATTHLSNAFPSPTNIRVHDMTFDGGSGASAREGCLSMNGVNSPTDITVERVICENVGGSGLNVSGSATNPGQRIKFLLNKIINAGLATGSVGQLYGIVMSFNSHSIAMDNEISGGALTTGITAFSGINPSADNAIVNVQIIGNRIHDLPFHTTPGGGIDVGRAKQVAVANNVIWNLNQGACVVFEAVWHGSISGNSCTPADTVITGGPIVVKTPDTTQSGEVASKDIYIVDNSINDQSLAADENGDITVNGAETNITISGNVITRYNQATAGGSPILLQLGVNDSNINTSGQNFCSNIYVLGNSIINHPGSSGATTIGGIEVLQQTTNCVPDSIVVANNTVRGFQTGISWASQRGSGMTKLNVHDNILKGNTTSLRGDGRGMVFYWNNEPLRGGLANHLMPIIPFSKFRLADEGQCTMTAGTCWAQTLSATYGKPPTCQVTWTGAGTLAGKIEVAATKTAVTPSSSVNTDTATVNWMCFGN